MFNLFFKHPDVVGSYRDQCQLLFDFILTSSQFFPNDNEILTLYVNQSFLYHLFMRKTHFKPDNGSSILIFSNYVTNSPILSRGRFRNLLCWPFIHIVSKVLWPLELCGWWVMGRISASTSSAATFSQSSTSNLHTLTCLVKWQGFQTENREAQIYSTEIPLDPLTAPAEDRELISATGGAECTQQITLTHEQHLSQSGSGQVDGMKTRI